MKLETLGLHILETLNSQFYFIDESINSFIHSSISVSRMGNHH